MKKTKRKTLRPHQRTFHSCIDFYFLNSISVALLQHNHIIEAMVQTNAVINQIAFQDSKTSNINPALETPIIPGNVAAVLEIAMIMDAYFGDISNGLAAYPATSNPRHPTPIT